METTTTLSGNLHTFYHRTLLASAEKQLKLKPLGMEKKHPRGNGINSFVLKYGNVATDITPLGEGVTPAAGTVDSNKYTVVLNQYGKHIPISDWIQKTAIDDTMKSVADRLGYAAAQTMDLIIQNELIASATSNLKYTGTGNTTDNDISASETFVALDALKGVRVLASGDAPKIGDHYVWVVHPNVSADIMADTAAGGFQELNKYVAGLAEKPLNGEIGRAYGARIVESSNIQSVANTGPVDVYRTLLLAKDAFVISKMDKDAIELIVKDHTSGGPSNPLNQVGTAGYKMEFGVKYIGGSFTNHNAASPDLCIQIRGAANS